MAGGFFFLRRGGVQPTRRLVYSVFIHYSPPPLTRRRAAHAASFIHFLSHSSPIPLFFDEAAHTPSRLFVFLPLSPLLLRGGMQSTHRLVYLFSYLIYNPSPPSVDEAACNPHAASFICPFPPQPLTRRCAARTPSRLFIFNYIHPYVTWVW